MIQPGAKKFFQIALPLGAIFGLYVYAQNQGWLKNILPKKNITVAAAVAAVPVSEGAKEAARENTPVLKVGVVTWGGYAGAEYFNKGFAANKDSRFYRDYGFEVEFIKNDDFNSSRDAWKAGAVDAMWATADSFVTEIDGLKDQHPQIIINADRSCGGDFLVVIPGITSASQLRGKRVAFLEGSPSESLLLSFLAASNMSLKDIVPVTTASADAAADMFKTHQVEAAVSWSPQDVSCLNEVPGATILFSSKVAPNIIYDVFFVKQAFLQKNRPMLVKFVEGWLKGAGEINSDPEAKAEAINILMAGLKATKKEAVVMINNARLSTLGDNQNFFNVNGDYNGITGESVWNKMQVLFRDANPSLVPASIPSWRDVSDMTLVQEVHLAGSANAAEGTAQFSAPTRNDETRTAIATKPVSVTFAFGSAQLDQNSYYIIDTYAKDVAAAFSRARVRIEGNTDNIGSDAGNRALSRRRAQSVKNYLVQKFGFASTRFVCVGNGADNPVADNSSDEGRAQNRRTEFSLLK